MFSFLFRSVRLDETAIVVETKERRPWLRQQHSLFQQRSGVPLATNIYSSFGVTFTDRAWKYPWNKPLRSYLTDLDKKMFSFLFRSVRLDETAIVVETKERRPWLRQQHSLFQQRSGVPLATNIYSSFGVTFTDRAYDIISAFTQTKSTFDTKYAHARYRVTILNLKAKLEWRQSGGRYCSGFDIQKKNRRSSASSVPTAFCEHKSGHGIQTNISWLPGLRYTSRRTSGFAWCRLWWPEGWCFDCCGWSLREVSPKSLCLRPSLLPPSQKDGFPTERRICQPTPRSRTTGRQFVRTRRWKEFGSLRPDSSGRSWWTSHLRPASCGWRLCPHHVSPFCSAW